MELSDLVTFSTVARLGGITRAADELNTVQSNVTQRVKALEAEIGTALFERHSRGMTLTGAGRRLCASQSASWRVVIQRSSRNLLRNDGRYAQSTNCLNHLCLYFRFRAPEVLRIFDRNLRHHRHSQQSRPPQAKMSRKPSHPVSRLDS
jgi:hypothetical protein